MAAMKQSQLVAKNVLAGGLSLVVGGLLLFAIILVVAHHLSVADFGIFSFITLFAFVVQRVADGGFSVILMRDLAVEPGRIGEVLGAMLAMAWASVVVAVVISALALAYPLGFDRRLVALIAAMGLVGLGDFIAGCWGAVLRAREDQEIFAVGFALHKVAILVLIIPFLHLGFGLNSVIFAYLAGTLVRWWLYRWVVCRRYARAHLRFDFGLWKYLVVESIPVGARSIGRLLGDQADLVILGLFAGTEAMGMFSGPYRMATGLGFLPQTVIIALAPLYARAGAQADKRPFQEAYERGIRVFLLLAFPAATLLLVCPETLTVAMLGAKFRAAAPAMQLMSFAVLMMFMGTPFPYLLAALNQQRFLLISTVADLLVRIILDLILVPRYGFLGPCAGLVASEGLVLAVWVAYLWMDGFTLPIVNILWRPIVGSLFAGALLYAAHASSLISLAAVSVVSVAIYLAVVLKLGAVSPVERDLVRESMEFLPPLLGWARRKA